MSRLLFLALLVSACEWNSGKPTGDATSNVDARRPVDAAPPEAHLLLNEIVLTPVGAEFIEIKNPTNKSFTLTDYYLADDGHYFELPLGAPTLSTTDFIVQFPAGAQIGPNSIITVATGTAAAFTTAYPGKSPTYSITDNTMIHTDVPGSATLTDAGEIVVLFTWDGTADLVSDVDMMIAGAATTQNTLVNKSAIMQGASKYAIDANTIAPQTDAPATGFSTKRIMPEDGNETQDGSGNGIAGDDETSEDTTVTWDTTYTAPTPGT